MSADDLVAPGAKASAAMVLTRFSINIPASATEELISRDHLLKSDVKLMCYCPFIVRISNVKLTWLLELYEIFSK